MKGGGVKKRSRGREKHPHTDTHTQTQTTCAHATDCLVASLTPCSKIGALHSDALHSFHQPDAHWLQPMMHSPLMVSPLTPPSKGRKGTGKGR